MPELPDVAVFKEYFDRTSLDQKIDHVDVRSADLLKDVSRRSIQQRLKGHPFRKTRRIGKHLFASVEGQGWLRLHFGMTGYLHYFEDSEDEPKHGRVQFDFANGHHLSFVNQRKFGEVGLVEDPDSYAENTELGPDALDLDLTAFRERLAGRRGGIKSTLMNQKVLAGLGNVYTDEILFQTDIHPESKAGDLDDDAVRDIHRAMKRIMGVAIRHEADPKDLPSSYLLPHRDEGAECPRCSGTIKKMKVSGRSTYYCSRHQ